MTRFFYIDPLAAAWMAKHFGMRFQDGCTGEEIWAAQIGTAFFAKGYVHPDSLHLLTPKADDLVEGIRIGTVFEVNGDELSVDVHGGDWEMDADRVTILRRDGKPFHTPERDPA